FRQGIPGELAEILPPDGFYQHASPSTIQEFKAFARVVALEDDPEKEQLIVREEENPGDEIRVQYNIAARNENFNPSIQAIKSVFGFPLILNLIDIEIDQEGIYRPKAFVIKPDYLVDVSAIAECFKENSALPWVHLLKKFLPFQTTKYLMIGNIANFFLDELMSHPEATFKATFPKVFQLNPLAFTILENREIREIMQNSQKHFLTLKRMVASELKEQDVLPEHCFLEPSFYAQQYGLQGRLDVFFQHPENEKDSAIVELKSGKAYMPNRWGLSHNHYVQTLLYDLMIKSVFGAHLSPTNFILYSGLDERPLRFAPVTKSKQFEALQLRNQLVATEQSLIQLMQQPLENAPLFNQLNPARMPNIRGFLSRDLAAFREVYSGMNDLERRYFLAFSGFIAREHQLAKTGVQGVEHINGQASLWLNDFSEKKEQFEIISQLTIAELKTEADDPIIRLSRTEEKEEDKVANFRIGDIAVLYPFLDQATNVLSNQIFKCTIIGIDKHSLQVRLRSKQFNNSIFHEFEHWNIEHDLFDSSFIAMYRSLYEFVRFPVEKKQLLLTQTAPQQATDIQEKRLPGLTMEQQRILAKAVAAPDYFLLWGPPGTGKTSVMLKHIVSHIINTTDENILLLAYTNRAVDEICESIESIDDFMKREYLRIGSRYSTAERFQTQLLNSKIQHIKSRQELKAVIDNHRIFVSTVASIAGKKELLKLKKFHRVIIDEASQILEPMLVGLLPYFERFILIGDHKQLPAVVVQPKEESAIEDQALQDIGLHNLRDSLFERLFKRCQENNWHWAYDRLSHQGRMHRDIMAFPNQFFYQGFLHILPEELPASQQQIQPLQFATPSEASPLERLLCQNRMVFIPTNFTEEDASKTNSQEAQLIANLIESYQKIHEANGEELRPSSIGVITPYRAQIAKIRQVVQQRHPDFEDMTIDTVERYQGGARNIILISLCVNRASQLVSLISASEEGVDRKLNVALTRARQHLVILGNEQLLKDNDIYRALIEHCHTATA
ncbi:MAG: AAA domain-containing protein, partial [Bacteroidota bacterium]